jgi:hypothetical protein
MSSSFVVPIRELPDYRLKKTGALILSLEKILKIMAEPYKFRPTTYLCPSQLENSTMCMKSIEEVPMERAEMLAKQVIGDHREVVAFLLQEDVPFKASCQYGQETIVYDGENIYSIQNIGVGVECFGLSYLTDNMKYIEPVSVMTREQWLSAYWMDPPKEEEDDEEPEGIDPEIPEQSPVAGE